MSNPFFTDDSDFAPSPYRPAARTPNKWLDDDTSTTGESLDSLEEQRQRSATRQLASTKRALASLNESENIGIDTAKDLVSQGEQLDSAETNLDKINKMTVKTQQSINSMKSIFGGIKSWWSGEAKKEGTTSTTCNTIDEEKPKSTLNNSIDSYPQCSANSTNRNPASARGHGQQTNFNKQLNNDLGDMSEGIGRLRGLALGLGDEIQKQNDQLDRITDKADRADTSINRQTKQIKDLLNR